MKFKRWLISEMAHFTTDQCVDGICGLDIRMEDWSIDKGQGLGRTGDKIPYVDVWRPIAGQIKPDLWFHTGGIGTGMILTREKPSGNFQFLPDGWQAYAEFYGDHHKIVKQAKFKR